MSGDCLEASSSWNMSSSWEIPVYVARFSWATLSFSELFLEIIPTRKDCKKEVNSCLHLPGGFDAVFSRAKHHRGILHQAVRYQCRGELPLRGEGERLPAVPLPAPAASPPRLPRRPRGCSPGARWAGAATHLHEVKAGQEGDAVLGHCALLPLLRGHAGGGCGRRPLAAARRGSPPPAAAPSPAPPASASLRRARGWRQEAAGRRGQGPGPAGCGRRGARPP